MCPTVGAALVAALIAVSSISRANIPFVYSRPATEDRRRITGHERAPAGLQPR